MAYVCTRCAFRFNRTATTNSSTFARTFSSTSARPVHAVPQFAETPDTELNNVLATMREKHFIPAALDPPQRKLIFSKKTREQLTNYPQAIDMGGETVNLQWIDRHRDIPPRAKLLRQAIKLMKRDESGASWKNLMPLLIGLKLSGVELNEKQMENLLRTAINAGHFDVIMQCLSKGDETGVKLTRPEVLGSVLLALTKQGREGDWSEEGLERAMALAGNVAQMLESEMHGGGKVTRSNDLRRQPRVIGVYLELNAMFAQKHQGGKDSDGRVRAYSERLLFNLEHVREIRETEPAQQGPQTTMLLDTSIYHGLALAQKILGPDMPYPKLAAKVIENYERGLSSLAEQLENRRAGGYADQALSAWEEATV